MRLDKPSSRNSKKKGGRNLCFDKSNSRNSIKSGHLGYVLRYSMLIAAIILQPDALCTSVPKLVCILNRATIAELIGILFLPTYGSSHELLYKSKKFHYEIAHSKENVINI